MKQFILIFFWLFLFLNIFAQQVPPADSLDTKTKKSVKEIKQNKNYNWGNDDIYAGKPVSDSLDISNDIKTKDYNSEEELSRKREHRRDVYDLILNVGLIIFWIFAYY